MSMATTRPAGSEASAPAAASSSPMVSSPTSGRTRCTSRRSVKTRKATCSSWPSTASFTSWCRGDGEGAGPDQPAQAILLEQAMRPGIPLSFQRGNRVGSIIDLQIVARAIVGCVENSLEIQRDVPVLGLEGNADRRQLLGQPDRPQLGFRAAIGSRDVNKVLMGGNPPIDGDRQPQAAEGRSRPDGWATSSPRAAFFHSFPGRASQQPYWSD